MRGKKRCGLAVLNFMITSNHIHLIVVDDDSKDVISKSMKLVVSRTAQEYNWRKNRKGRDLGRIAWSDPGFIFLFSILSK